MQGYTPLSRTQTLHIMAYSIAGQNGTVEGGGSLTHPTLAMHVNICINNKREATQVSPER
eukprot:326031-Amphidinium_carterae.2